MILLSRNCLAVLIAVVVVGALPAEAADASWEAHLMINRGEYDRALKYLEPLVNGAEKDNARVHFYYAQLLKRKGLHAEAKAHLEECLRLNPYGWETDSVKRALAEMKEEEGPPQITPSTTKGGRRGYVGLMFKSKKIVSHVFSNSPAAKAHILAGDKIITVDGRPASANVDELTSQITGLEGTTVNLVIERRGKTYKCPIKRAAPGQLQRMAIRGIAPNDIIGRDLEKRTSEAANASKPSTARPSNSPPSNAPELTKPNGVPDETDKSMISILRKTSDSELIYDQVIYALHLIPIELKKTMAQWGLKIVIAPTVVEAFPEFLTEKPRGYTHGGNYTNCGGLFRGKTIYVAERVQTANHPPQLNIQLVSTFIHEFGHAYDSYIHMSKSEAFIKAYEDDCKHISSSVKDQFYYFTQPGEAGPSEMLADLLVAAIVPSSDRVARANELSKNFPRCFELTRKRFVVPYKLPTDKL